MNYFLIALFTLLSFSEALAQRFLYVHKVGSTKAYTLQSGDAITFKLAGDTHFRTDVIHSVGDSSLIFNFHRIPINDITAISKSSLGKANITKGLGSVLMTAGIVYIGADQFNSVVVRKEGFILDRSTLFISSGLVAEGYLLKKLSRSYVKIKSGHYQIKVLEPVKAPETWLKQ